MDDEQVETDPLFTALTHPPRMLGVPYVWFGLLFIVAGIGVPLTGTLVGVGVVIGLVVAPLYGIGLVLTEKDAHWMGVILTKFNKCGPTLNKKYWGADSYSP